VGYESVNQSSLDRQGKRAAAGDYREVIKEIFAAGIIPSGNWMFGFDQDMPDTFARTLAFLDETDLMHCSFTTEIPFPGTAAWRKYKKEGRLLTEDYDDYVGKDHVVVRPKEMTPQQLQDGIRWLARKFYSVPRAGKRLAKAFANPKLHALGPAILKGPALAGLNVFQVWQWHYRMFPPLQAFYRRLLTVYRHRYVMDHVRKTNFRELPAQPAWTAPKEGGSFFTSQGYQPSHAVRLKVYAGQVAAAPRP